MRFVNQGHHEPNDWEANQGRQQKSVMIENQIQHKLTRVANGDANATWRRKALHLCTPR